MRRCNKGEYRKLWWTLIAELGVTVCLRGWFGREVYRQATPIPQQVQSADGRLLFTGDDILNGQTAGRSVGGMQLGSIWGHGAYQAPDWTADWLHRELTAWPRNTKRGQIYFPRKLAPLKCAPAARRAEEGRCRCLPDGCGRR